MAKGRHRSDCVTRSLESEAQLGLRVAEAGLQFDRGLQLANGAVGIALIGKDPRQIEVCLCILRREINSPLQLLLSLVQRALSPTDDAEVEFRGSKLRLQAKGFGELSGRFFELRILHEEHAQFVMQLSASRFKFRRATKFENRRR